MSADGAATADATEPKRKGSSMDRTSRAFRRLGYLMLIMSSWLLSCKAEERFPALDAKIAGPADIATSPSGKLFLVEFVTPSAG